MHVHTIFSKHAYSTIKEIVDSAFSVGIDYIGITDHYFNDGTELEKKNEMNRIMHCADFCNDFPFIISSAEFNLSQEVYHVGKVRSLLWRPIGLHNWFLEYPLDCYNYVDVIEMFRRNTIYANAFVHIERDIGSLHRCGNSQLPITDKEIKEYLEQMVVLAKEKDVFLELNEGSFSKKINEDRIRYWLGLAKENGNKICLGTDSHYCKTVGRFDRSIMLLNDLEFPMNRILNCDKQWVEQYCNIER